MQCARINGVTGHVMLCAGPRVLLYTLNGRLLLDQRVCETEEPDDVVNSCAFYEGVGNEWVARELMFTGHRRGVVNVGRFFFSPFHRRRVDVDQDRTLTPHRSGTRPSGALASGGSSL